MTSPQTAFRSGYGTGVKDESTSPQVHRLVVTQADVAWTYLSDD